MNIYAWIGLAGIVLFSGLPFLSKSYRTKQNTFQFMKMLIIIAGIIFFVNIIHVPFILAFIIGIILYILFTKKTYTKKRGMIYGAILLVTIAAFYITANIFFKSNPEYTLKHLLKNPDTSSLFVAVNGKEKITYHSDVPRPLASAVKTVIAVEYAYQIDQGAIQKDDMVALENLDSYYIKNTDGGAHEAWLDDLKEQGKVKANKVALNDVAKGMITYSSNANTEYLIDLLGVERINDRIAQLELTKHDDIIPIVGALVTVSEFKKDNGDKEWMDTLRKMPDDEFTALAMQNSEKLKHGNVDLEAASNLALDEQHIWSDRLANASAKDYGQLLRYISNDEFPEEVSSTIRELMEWPMEKVEGNKEHYKVVGAKGGSTAFVLNQTMYVEDLDGDKVELVLFMDDLSLWKSIVLQNQINGFIKEVINNDVFREKVQNELEDEKM